VTLGKGLNSLKTVLTLTFCIKWLKKFEIPLPNRYTCCGFCNYKYTRSLQKEVQNLARRRKRKSRRRQEGRRILEHIPQFSLESGEDKPVTAARKYIQAEGILPPALLLVKRNEHTTDRYFWAEKGLFGAQYVEENHFLFPSLKLDAEEMALSGH
jgi:hypothetical protein